jgi:16S rRNA (guanine527-N7)-methyltransferase
MHLAALTQNEIWLRTIVQKNNLTITDIELSKLSEYSVLLAQWNKSLNLISRRDEENLWRNHILVSLVLLFKIEFPSGARILDLGTGGGLPGIPLSIMRRDIEFVLVDSIRKKTTAVQDMIGTLGLPNVKVVCGRAEDLGQLNLYGRTFDAVIARAVSSLDNLVVWAAPFLKIGEASKKFIVSAPQRIVLSRPVLISMKGGDLSAETDRARKQFPHIKLHSFDVTFNGSEVLENFEKKIILVETN